MWEIKPNTQIGPLIIGIAIDQCLGLLGEYETFKRVPEAEETIYAFDNDAVHLTVDADKKVAVISVFRPNVITYNGVHLLGRSAMDVVNDLSSNGVGAVREDAGFWVANAGVLLVEVEGLVDGVELYGD